MSDHLDTLKQYQRWRRGEEDWSPDERGPDPKELGRVIDATIAEVERLRKGEFICQRCGLRKDDEHPKGDF